ncbi:conserved hypothetical protein [Pediculus humanus corporis]|uniref:Rab-GAP TBC domain-containing protein n=1 Tax=Pediculus humanus subsp. corporis TaxID=121224 RepID=E0W319_PEDHC|nr:uncharacterized protein Phum_PHUM600250 [Pediculus humanus corporis]EEB20025.1 conserved hypothetical protein [Pediculus humanus corporis]
MDDMKDRSIHFTAQKLTEDIQNMPLYHNFYTDLQKLVSSSSVKKGDFRNSLMDALRHSGMGTELRNSIFHWIRAHSNHLHNQHAKEPLAYLRKAQMQWEKRIHKSLNSMSNDLGVPLSRFRLASDRDEIQEKWTELSTYDVDLSQYRPVYAPKDFLDVLMSIRSPNYNLIRTGGNWDFTQIPLKVKTLSDLRVLYNELSRGEPFLGLEPTLIMKIIFKVLSSKHAPTAQEFLKKGCPKSIRGRIWSQVLGSEPKAQHTEYFSELKSLVLQYDLMIDKLVIKDVQLTASNDDQYFVFEDVLYQVMLCFSRDADVLSVVPHSSISIENTVAYPPSGVIPFHGFTMYVNLYHTFRAFYLRYWFRLHEVSSHEQSILPLCLLFERLLQKQEPQLWLHLKLINVQPIRIVFKWIMRAFSGHLPPEQLLYLWDLILAYDSLEVLPLLAVAIISFRKNNLLKVDTLHNIEEVLADLSSIRVMSLIHLCLLKEL